MAEDWKKRDHSKNLLVLLYIAHVLPQAFKSKYILGNIFFLEDRTQIWGDPRNFHANFPLDGRNDHTIQPARDAVLDYYNVRTPCLTYAVLMLIHIRSKKFHYLNQRYAEPSNVEVYMRLNNLS